MKVVFIMLFACFAFGSEILLLSKFDEKEFQNKDFNEYLMSEKLDGVRGIWNGKEFKTRQDYKINVPLSFIQNFPPFDLDGEFFIARMKFDEISALIRSGELENELWQSVSFNVFDVPNACEEFKLSACSLENRLAILEQYLQKNPNSKLKIIPHFKVKNYENLKKFYTNIVQEKGEGIVLRKNLNIYYKGRSKEDFKLKPFEDAECEVVGYTKGKGKFEGKVGSLLCKMPNEKIIKIGSGLKDKDRQNPPPLGSTITYKFSGYTKNSLPRFPIFLRIRNEIP